MKKKYSKFTHLLLILLPLMLFSLFCQAGWSSPINQVTINYIEATATPDKLANQVSIFVTVTGADEQSISGLSRSDFEAVEDGKQVDINEVSQAGNTSKLPIINFRACTDCIHRDTNCFCCCGIYDIT